MVWDHFTKVAYWPQTIKLDAIIALGYLGVTIKDKTLQPWHPTYNWVSTQTSKTEKQSSIDASGT
jgi:hypothetical protein